MSDCRSGNPSPLTSSSPFNTFCWRTPNTRPGWLFLHYKLGCSSRVGDSHIKGTGGCSSYLLGVKKAVLVPTHFQVTAAIVYKISNMIDKTGRKNRTGKIGTTFGNTHFIADRDLCFSKQGIIFKMSCQIYQQIRTYNGRQK